MLLILGISLAGRGNAQATLKRALFYGPTSNTDTTPPGSPGLAEQYVNSVGSPFAPIGPGPNDSKVWDEATWLTKTTADFAQFDIIIFGDEPRNQNASRSRWNTAVANRAAWSAAVTGNVLIFGGDPDDIEHDTKHGSGNLVRRAMDFGADQTGFGQHVTGLYVALGQVEFGIIQGNDVVPETVELLAGFGEIKAIHQDADNSIQVATHPVVDCLADDLLSDWHASCHVGFMSWPSTFKPLALVTDAKVSTPGYFPHCFSYEGVACDVSALCYILARGGFVNELTATPCLTASAVGLSRTITAQFKTTPGGAPITGQKIGFKVVGANGGAVGVTVPANGLTDANGKVTFTYTGVNAGKDKVRVFVDYDLDGGRDLCEPGTLAVLNWANQTITVTAPDPTAAEPWDTGLIRFTRTGNLQGDIIVDYCVSGTAFNDTDKFQFGNGSIVMPGGVSDLDVLVIPIADSILEPTETLVVTLKEGTGSAYFVGSPSSAMMTIADDDADTTVKVRASGNTSETSLTPVTITFHRSGPASQGLNIFFSLPTGTGSALYGADYTLSPAMTGEILIPANETTATMTLTPLQDSRDEGDETVTIQILPDAAYQLGVPSVATIAIEDNDHTSLLFEYTITALGPSTKPSHAFGINSSGRVAGDYALASPGEGDWWRGFSWYNGTLTTIGIPYGSQSCTFKVGCGLSHGLGINDSGLVVGYGGLVEVDSESSDIPDTPFRWTPGPSTPTALGLLSPNQPLGNQAVAINNNGDIVGFSKNNLGKTRAVRWPAGSTTPQDMFTLAGQAAGKESYAAGIGLSGRIVGKSMISTDSTTFHAFRTSPLSGILPSDDLGNLVGAESLNSEANWINDFDEVVGATAVASGQYHAFWKDAYTGKHQGFIDLGVLAGDHRSVALGLNKTGHAVGYSQNTVTGNQRAVVWFNNGVTWDLIAHVSNGSGWALKSAEAINKDGWIVGWGTKGGLERGFLLVPNQY